MSKTYANRSNALRAIRASGVDSNTIVLKQDDAGKWYWEAKAAEPAAPKAPRYKLHRRKPKAAVAPATPAAAAPQAPALPATVPAHKVFQVHGKSTIVSPVKVVHDFLDANGANLTRKQALFQLAQLGINYATARTQFQRWFAKNK